MEYLNKMTDFFLPLQPGTFYHVYNRGNNGENIFYKTENYRYFLRKFDQYLTPFLGVYAYCLLPNHFHFLVKTKERLEISSGDLQVKAGTKILTDFAQVTSEEFRRFFLSYAKSIKIQEGRTGSLFEKNFKRIEIQSDKHLVWLFNYIHRNPETHRLVTDFRTYPYSSYRSILSTAPTKLKRTEVITLFGSRDEFIRYHETNPVLAGIETLLME